MPSPRRPATPAPAGVVLALVVLAGCASAPTQAGPTTTTAGSSRAASSPSTPAPASSRSTPAPASSPSTAAPASSPPAARVVEVSVRISGGTVEPPPSSVEVEEGATVRLRVTSDTADELHVHGYDEEETLAPGRESVLEFVADRSGAFEVETHESGRTLLRLLVR